MRWGLAVFLVAGLTMFGCERQTVSESVTDTAPTVEEVLRKNPEIVFEILLQNPDRLLEVLETAFASQNDMDWQDDGDMAGGPVRRIPEIDLARPVRGNAHGPVSLVVYSDFLCAYCKTTAESLDQIFAHEEREDLRLVFKHLPMSPDALALAHAFEALAAMDGNLAWSFHDAVFARQEEATADVEGFIAGFLDEHHLDAQRFEDLRQSPETAALVAGDIAEAGLFEVDGTPTILFNGIAVQGALPLEELLSIVDHVRPRFPEISPERPMLGNPAAPFTIVNYVDFLCPFSASAWPVVLTLLADSGDDVRIFLKHMPIQGESSERLAQAFEAVALQSPNMAWEFAEHVFKNQNQAVSDPEILIADAGAAVGADMERLLADVGDASIIARVDADLAEAEGFGFFGVPMFLLNGHPLHGLIAQEEFLNVMDYIRSEEALRR